jgi:hypothetical protein
MVEPVVHWSLQEAGQNAVAAQWTLFSCRRDLPRLEVREANGAIEVFAPPSSRRGLSSVA